MFNIDRLEEEFETLHKKRVKTLKTKITKLKNKRQKTSSLPEKIAIIREEKMVEEELFKTKLNFFENMDKFLKDHGINNP